MIQALAFLISVLAQTTDSESATSTAVTSSSAGSSQTVTISASSAAVTTISAPAKEVVSVTYTEKLPCSSTATVTVTTTPKPKKLTLCVKCYDKIFNTPDCKKCTMVCEDGTKIDSMNSENSKNCPNKDPRDVPCPCKDEYGRVIPDNYYRSSGLISKNDFSDLIDNVNYN